MFWTTKEIAEKVGLTPQHVRLLIRQGKIRAQKKGHDWWVDEEEARRFIESYKK